MPLKLGATGITFHDNTVQTTAASGGGLTGFTVYTSGTTAFTVPAGITKILVEVVGGGGGASASPQHTGGGGGYAKGMLTVTPGQTINAVVGAVGTTGSGGTTSFSTISATGGTKAATGLGGSGSGGAFNITGGNANNSETINGAGGAGGGMDAQSVVLPGEYPTYYYLPSPDLYKGFGRGKSWNGCAPNGYGGSGGIILLTY
jgi:hypothetical protein